VAVSGDTDDCLLRFAAGHKRLGSLFSPRPSQSLGSHHYAIE